LILTSVLGAGLSQHLWEMLAGRKGARFAEVRRAMGNLFPREALARCLVSALVVALIAQGAIALNRLYEFGISSSRYQRAARFVEAAGVALAACVGVTVLADLWGLERVLDFPGLSLSQRVQTLVVSLITAFALLYLWRVPYHGLMRHVSLNQRLLVLGSRGPAHSLAYQVHEHPEAGYEVCGLVPEPDLAPVAAHEEHATLVATDHEATAFSRALILDSDLLTRDQENRGVAMTAGANGDPDGLLALVREHSVDMIVVALEDRRRTLPTQDLLACRLAGVEVREREEVYEEITGRIAVSAMRPSYLIFNEGFRRDAWAELMKRAVDVSLALTILLLSWPLMLLTALAVRLDSPGPILFKQERVGLEGRRFTLMKFRSMRADAEKLSGPVWSSEDDPRITRVGRFIRKTRLDELPQLFNVLRGSMSLVGPRPERQHFVDELAEMIPYYHQRHIVKPGLTGWAQINYPYGNTQEDALHKLQYELFYIKNHSVLFDLSILFSTIRTVVLRQGT
jgi:lipopolysaccharide/colanic/teichoic acid biosynthesis glycosyltransferase